MDVVVDDDGMLDREEEVFERAHAPHLVLTVRLAHTLSCAAMHVVHVDVHDHDHVHVEAHSVRAFTARPVALPRFLHSPEPLARKKFVQELL